ncbi:hypothetical protein SDC9_187457 [bioreactor metagenome]|uniref:Uncharacterized protein n=1 Tax=bioreactor metagenome TaxID=1076179 RepID=A0A645HX56_9ZZZZ
MMPMSLQVRSGGSKRQYSSAASVSIRRGRGPSQSSRRQWRKNPARSGEEVTNPTDSAVANTGEGFRQNSQNRNAHEQTAAQATASLSRSAPRRNPATGSRNIGSSAIQ